MELYEFRKNTESDLLLMVVIVPYDDVATFLCLRGLAGLAKLTVGVGTSVCLTHMHERSMWSINAGQMT